jgi:hypothetical protein
LFRARGIPNSLRSNYRLGDIRKVIGRLVPGGAKHPCPRTAIQSLSLAALGLTLTALIFTTTQPRTQDVPPPAEDIGALLLIVGCFDDLSQCHELAVPVSIFETMEACDQQLPASFGAFTAQFEQLYAQCLPVDPAMEDEAELVWQIHQDGTMFASVEPAPQRIEPTTA